MCTTLFFTWAHFTKSDIWCPSECGWLTAEHLQKSGQGKQILTIMNHDVKNSDSKFVSDDCLLLYKSFFSLLNLFPTLRSYLITRIKFKSQSTYLWFVSLGLCVMEIMQNCTRMWGLRLASWSQREEHFVPSDLSMRTWEDFAFQISEVCFFRPSNHNSTSVGFFLHRTQSEEIFLPLWKCFSDEEQVEKASCLLSESIRMLPGECPRVDNMLLFWRSRIQVELTLLQDAGVMALKPRCE